MTETFPRLLYVEDDPNQRMLLSAILEQSGFRVFSAQRALDGLELAAQECFDAVILDYDLPDMTGAQLAQEIRALEPAAKIILLSGRGQLPAGELVYVDIHIVKGSLTEHVIETVFALINQHEVNTTGAGCHYA